MSGLHPPDAQRDSQRGHRRFGDAFEALKERPAFILTFTSGPEIRIFLRLWVLLPATPTLLSVSTHELCFHLATSFAFNLIIQFVHQGVPAIPYHTSKLPARPHHDFDQPTNHGPNSLLTLHPATNRASDGHMAADY